LLSREIFGKEKAPRPETEIKSVAGAPPLADEDVKNTLCQLNAMEAITTDAGIVRLRETVTARYTTLPPITPL